jgi:death-on-curing protein
MTDYLTVVEILAIHDDQITRYGGGAGVRDRGLLEAALYRPQTGYYADLIEEAAALWESLAQNHPFINVTISAGGEDIYNFIIGLYESGTFDFDHLRTWLRANIA